jgi:hypothetical protein
VAVEEPAKSESNKLFSGRKYLDDTDHFLDYLAYMAEVAKEEGTLDGLPVQLNNMDEKEASRLTILVCQQRKRPITYQL